MTSSSGEKSQQSQKSLGFLKVKTKTKTKNQDLVDDDPLAGSVLPEILEKHESDNSSKQSTPNLVKEEKLSLREDEDKQIVKETFNRLPIQNTSKFT